MKNNRRAFIGVVSLIVIAILITVFYFNMNSCEPDGETVCYSQTESFFKVEPGAYLSVQVESEAQGEYLVETWNTLHPENRDALVYLVKEPLSASKIKEGLTQDISITSLDTASYFLEDFYSSNELGNVVSSKIPSQLEDMINYNGFYFTPNSISGPVFVYNKTLMEELGFDTSDTTGSGLPDIFDTWEQIIEAQEVILKDLPIVFPLTFTDQNSFYPFLTSGHWRLFISRDSMNPGYDSHEFLKGLDLIVSLSEVVLDKNTATEVVEEIEVDKEDAPIDNSKTNESSDSSDATVDNDTTNQETESPVDNTIETPKPKIKLENTAQSLPWQYEKAFYDRQTLFTLLDPNTTQFKEYDKASTDEYKVSILPTFNGGNLSPLANVYGYVIKNDVKFPSAASEVVRILRTPESLSLYNVESGTYPIYSSKFIEDLTIDDPKTLDYIKAYNYHDTASVMALKGNPQVLAKSIYKEVDIMQPLMELFNGNITKEQTQKDIVELSNRWYESKEVEE